MLNCTDAGRKNRRQRFEDLVRGDGAHAGIGLGGSLIARDRSWTSQHRESSAIRTVTAWIGGSVKCDAWFAQSCRQVHGPAIDADDRRGLPGGMNQARNARDVCLDALYLNRLGRVEHQRQTPPPAQKFCEL